MAFETIEGQKKRATCLWCKGKILSQHNQNLYYCDVVCFRNWHNSQAAKRKDKYVKVNNKTWVMLKKGETEKQAIERMQSKLGDNLTLEGMAESNRKVIAYRNKQLNPNKKQK
jgi:hypothetical protein